MSENLNAKMRRKELGIKDTNLWIKHQALYFSSLFANQLDMSPGQENNTILGSFLRKSISEVTGKTMMAQRRQEQEQANK